MKGVSTPAIITSLCHFFKRGSTNGTHHFQRRPPKNIFVGKIGKFFKLGCNMAPRPNYALICEKLNKLLFCFKVP